MSEQLAAAAFALLDFGIWLDIPVALTPRAPECVRVLAVKYFGVVVLIRLIRPIRSIRVPSRTLKSDYRQLAQLLVPLLIALIHPRPISGLRLVRLLELHLPPLRVRSSAFRRGFPEVNQVA